MLIQWSGALAASDTGWQISHQKPRRLPIHRLVVLGDDADVQTRIEPGTKALRRGRISEVNRIYIVTFVTHDRYPFFNQLRPARIVACALNRATGQKTHCYVVMPDHVHWLLELRASASLSGAIQECKSVSAHGINRALNRRGKVWQAGFHDHALRTEERMLAAARYIIGNPIRAGLCERVEDYPHWDAAWIE